MLWWDSVWNLGEIEGIGEGTLPHQVPSASSNLSPDTRTQVQTDSPFIFPSKFVELPQEQNPILPGDAVGVGPRGCGPYQFNDRLLSH